VTVSRLLSGRSGQGGRDHIASPRRDRPVNARRPRALVARGAGGLFAVAIKSSRNWLSVGAALFVLGMAIFAVYLARRVYADDGQPPAGRFTPFVVFVYRRRIARCCSIFACRDCVYSA
jgi:hypothetical protein